MADVSPYIQIDFVFNYIKEYLKHSATISTEYIWNYVKRTPEMGINNLMFQDILKRLKEDKLIEEQDMPPGDDNDKQRMYHITFDGRLFIGYEAKRKKDARLAENDLRNTRFLVWGGALAGAYSLVEIAKSFLSLYAYENPSVFSFSTGTAVFLFLFGGVTGITISLLSTVVWKK